MLKKKATMTGKTRRLFYLQAKQSTGSGASTAENPVAPVAAVAPVVRGN